jgi:hypothetical protein
VLFRGDYVFILISFVKNGVSAFEVVLFFATDLFLVIGAFNWLVDLGVGGVVAEAVWVDVM